MPARYRFSEVLRKVTHGVFVISTRYKDKVNAMTAAWVGRASFEPPLVTVAIGRERYTHELIMHSGVFAVNVLGPDNISLGKHFGFKSGRDVDKFAGIDYTTGPTGSPILKECVAWLDCKVYSHHTTGDHTLFVGEVLDAKVLKEGSALVYRREDFF